MFQTKLNSEWFEVSFLHFDSVNKFITSDEFNAFANTILNRLGDKAFPILKSFYENSISLEYKAVTLATIGKIGSPESLQMLTSIVHNSSSIEEINVVCHTIARFYSGNGEGREILIDYYTRLLQTERNPLHMTVESALGLLGKNAIAFLHEAAKKQINNKTSTTPVNIFYGDLLGHLKGTDIKEDLLTIYEGSGEKLIKQMCIHAILANYGADAADDLQKTLMDTNDQDMRTRILHSLYRLDNENIPEKYRKFFEQEIIRNIDSVKDPKDALYTILGARTIKDSPELCARFKAMLESNLQVKFGDHYAHSIKNAIIIYFVMTGSDDGYLYDYIRRAEPDDKVLILQRLSEGRKEIGDRGFELLKDSLLNNVIETPHSIRSLLLGLSKYKGWDDPVKVVSDYYEISSRPELKIAAIENSVFFGSKANNFLTGILKNATDPSLKFASIGSLLNMKENRKNPVMLEVLKYYGRQLIDSILTQNKEDPHYTVYIPESGKGASYYNRVICDYFSLFGTKADIAILDNMRSQVYLVPPSGNYCDTANITYSIDTGINKAKEDILLREELLTSE